MATVDPPLFPIPKKLLNDPELSPYFIAVQRWQHDMWNRTGGGVDKIENIEVTQVIDDGFNRNKRGTKNDIEKLHSTVDSLKLKCFKYDKELRELKDQISSEKLKCFKYDKELKELKDQISSEKLQKSQIKKELEALKSTLSIVKQQARKAAPEPDFKVANLKKEIQGLEGIMELYRSDSRRTSRNLEKQITDLEERYDSAT